ncbi:N-6 DNA methylase [Bernardetia sp. OM2101]|uniref:class I SAM-dependent DNA methyltransferase n=1 Tax=Bernardetia sp. OM2101 TaxID=3344876 RepID=UPI0035D07FF0
MQRKLEFYIIVNKSIQHKRAMDIVGKLWGFCHKLRHDGVDSADYIEQLTYLLFLKMADEKKLVVPNDHNWQALLFKSDDDLIKQLDDTLKVLKKESGILGQIFAEPVSRIKNPLVLQELIQEIDNINWTELDADVVGLAFEELIGKVASEGKKGAGQYFTPRPLIQSIVRVMQPNPFITENYKIADVACGTAGFLTVASEWVKKNHSKELENKQNQERFAKQIFYGQELVQRPRRLALMNLFLHGVDTSETISFGDSIENDQMPNELDLILANPPFGSKGSAPVSRVFPVKTSDKQLNFLQLIIEKLKKEGQAAVVLPDSCLGGRNAKKIWSYYLDKEKSGKNVCNLHTILKLPEGIFASYANGVKACVVFLEKGKSTKELWMYDARKDTPKITTRSNTLTEAHFTDFEVCFQKRKATERFKPHNLAEIKEKEFDLSFVEFIPPEPLPHPAFMIDQMVIFYEAKIKALKELKTKLPPYNEDEYENGFLKTTKTLESKEAKGDSEKTNRRKTNASLS